MLLKCVMHIICNAHNCMTAISRMIFQCSFAVLVHWHFRWILWYDFDANDMITSWNVFFCRCILPPLPDLFHDNLFFASMKLAACVSADVHFIYAPCNYLIIRRWFTCKFNGTYIIPLTNETVLGVFWVCECLCVCDFDVRSSVNI